MWGIVGVAVIVLLVGGWFAYSNWSGDSMTNSDLDNQNGDVNQTQTKGSLYITMTDAAANMNAVTAVNMTVDKVYIHNQTDGWVAVSQTPQTFDLLALHASGSQKLVAKVDATTGTYDQIWFHMTNVAVTESGKVKTATLPSGDFKMTGTIKVVADAASSAKIDVLADKSLYKTAKGEFIFAPVVNFESRSSATANVDSNNIVTVTGGVVESTTTAGMDFDGSVKANFKLDLNANVQINGGVISLPSASGTTQTNASVNVGY